MEAIPMISKELTKALSEQINAEYYAAYIYLAMSAWADSVSLKGCANWLFAQAQEEMAHGTNMYEYVLDRGAVPSFYPIQAPVAEYTNITEVFKAVLSHEQKVTTSINEIATLAMKENDHACYQFIMWYVNEQVEEEASASEVLDKLEMIGESKAALLVLDNELATRVFVDPFPSN